MWPFIDSWCSTGKFVYYPTQLHMPNFNVQYIEPGPIPSIKGCLKSIILRKVVCLFCWFFIVRSPKPNYSIKEGCLFVLFVMLRSPKPTFQLRKGVCLFCLSYWDLSNQSILLKREVCLFCLSQWDLPNHNTFGHALSATRKPFMKPFMSTSEIILSCFDLWWRRLLDIEYFWHWKFNEIK